MSIPEETRDDTNRTEDDAVDSSTRPNDFEHDEAVTDDPGDRTEDAPVIQEQDRTADDDRAEARAGALDGAEEAEALVPADSAERFRERWESVQAGFVDQPRETVEQADDLVRDLVQELTAGFVERRQKLERHWNEGDEASTEDLRIALTHYRAFFNRLLST